MGDLLGQFTSGQGNKLQGLFGMLGGDSGGMEGRASEKGMDPSLITGMLSMLGGGGGGASGGGGGFNLQSLLQVFRDCQIFHYSIWMSIIRHNLCCITMHFRNFILY